MLSFPLQYFFRCLAQNIKGYQGIRARTNAIKVLSNTRYNNFIWFWELTKIVRKAMIPFNMIECLLNHNDWNVLDRRIMLIEIKLRFRNMPTRNFLQQYQTFIKLSLFFSKQFTKELKCLFLEGIGKLF